MFPVRKDPAIEQVLDELFGRTMNIIANSCVACGQTSDFFRDELSRKEFTISGLCQACQDEVFGGDPE